MLLWLLWNLVTLVADEEAPVRRETKICRAQRLYLWLILGCPAHVVEYKSRRCSAETNSLKLKPDRGTPRGKHFKSYGVEKKVKREIIKEE